MADQVCGIWQTRALSSESTHDGFVVDSPRAGGKYYFSGSAKTALERLDEKAKVNLTDWLVEQRRLGIAIPEVYSYTLSSLTNTREKGIPDRADRLLLYMQDRTNRIGDYLKFDQIEISLEEMMAWTGSTNTSEIQFLSEYCAKKEWIEFRQKPTSGSGSFNQGVRLLPGGFLRIDELRGRNVESSQAFVAMWFDPSVEDAFHEAIAPAVLDAGYKPLRIDKAEHNNKIDDEIIAEIRRSRFIIADFTHGESGMRGGVYYEAGFAHGLSVPVIFTCRKDKIDAIHFDTRQYNHILWLPDKLDEFQKALSDRISATIGDGPLKKA